MTISNSIKLFDSDIELLRFAHNEFNQAIHLQGKALVALPLKGTEEGYSIHLGFSHVFTITSSGSFVLNQTVLNTIDEELKKYLNKLLEQMDFYTITTHHLGYDITDPINVSWRTAKNVSDYRSKHYNYIVSITRKNIFI